MGISRRQQWQHGHALGPQGTVQLLLLPLHCGAQGAVLHGLAWLQHVRVFQVLGRISCRGTCVKWGGMCAAAACV